MERADSPVIWDSYRAEVAKLKSSVDAVLASDPSIPANAKLARVNRLELRKIRIEIENKRKELGEGLLRKKQAIDGAAKELKELIEPYEGKLLEIEQYAERIEEERIKKLTAERVEALSKYTQISSAINYGAMSEEEFETLLTDTKKLHELKQEEARRLEEARIAREKAEAEERERIRLENERLRKEAEEREAAIKAEREKVEAERQAAEEKARKEREAIEAKAKAEREESERKAAEEAARLKAIADKERKEREAAEAKIAAQKEEEEKARKLEEAAKRRAASAPDAEKVKSYAKAIAAIPVPELKTEAGKTLAKEIATTATKFANWLNSKAEELTK